MDNTLKARLERVQSLRGLADKLQIKVEETEFGDAEVRILKEFYAQDHLAYAVAGEKDSYLTKIQFIEEKYSTFWRKAFAPKNDEAFDQEVIRVIGSINGIGEYRDCVGRPLNSGDFTTVGRRKTARNLDLLALVPGSLFGLMAAEFTYHAPKCYQTALICYEERTGMIGTASLVAMVPLLFSGMVKLIQGSNASYDLERLREAAQKTDEFLRNHYV